MMDGRTSERLRSNRSIMGVLDGVSSEAVVVHQERCAKVRNRNVACSKWWWRASSCGVRRAGCSTKAMWRTWCAWDVWTSR